jgi:2-hydroxy-6-oxonona-2,4-dienedioate hydrolase
MQIVVNGTLLSYVVVNDKASQDVIVLHGWGHSGDLWITAVQMLPRQYRYIILDLPGFGGSQNLIEGSSVPEYSEVILAFIRKIKVQNPVIIGHSFGGQIAADMVLKRPNQILKLILISPAVGRKRSTKQMIKVWLYKNFSKLKPEFPEIILRGIIGLVSSSDYYGSSEALKAVLSNIVEYDLLDKVGEIDMPVKILWGERDTEIPYIGKVLVEHIPDAELYVMYGVGHNPHLTDPKQLTRLVEMVLEVR